MGKLSRQNAPRRHKLLARNWTPTSPPNDIYFQFIFMCCNTCIFIFPGHVFISIDNASVKTKKNRLVMLSPKCLLRQKSNKNNKRLAGFILHLCTHIYAAYSDCHSTAYLN